MCEYIIRETGYPGTLKTETMCELIRCKDCAYNLVNMVSGVPKGEEIADHCERFIELPITKDFFCPYGERRNNESNLRN